MIDTVVVADYGDLCGEAPLWDPESRALYWCDSVGRKFYRYHPSSGKHELVKDGVEVNGLALNRPGGFVITNNSGIWLWDGADKLKLTAESADGAKCQMNDAIADPEGRLVAGSWFYDPNKTYELGKLIRADPDGTAHAVDEGFQLANGLAFSPDAHKLYFTDSVARRIYAYDYDRKTCNLRNRQVLVQVPEDEGLPDGLTVDAEGFLWSAQWYGSCVVRYDPDGKIERRVRTPAKQTSSVMVGGDDLTDLFITSAARSEPMPIMPKAYDNSGYFGGQLYRIETGIQGRPEYKTNFNLPL
jgi:sugar lactone lactonase YvrE